MLLYRATDSFLSYFKEVESHYLKKIEIYSFEGMVDDEVARKTKGKLIYRFWGTSIRSH